ncbi:spore germination protein [Paenibacillus phyllosphaerae]|uniref:Spore germination protein n=1 Tax=Paenibacillus phyllosphaerae TaxID=274593 RepID=A0A7W5AU89_9BACL|nr:spore germination protein [Paenibacillus phyllosphaerae]MBB3108246.1 spore germination protein [Paenibacillus phyllosphaerae]
MLNRIETIMAQAKDLNTHRIQNNTITIEVAYISSLCDESKVSDFILVPFLKDELEFQKNISLNPNFIVLTDTAKWSETLLRGFVLVQLEGTVYTLDAARVIRNENPQTQVETAIMGSQVSLSEDLIDSINIIRSRYPSPELAIEERTVGNCSRTRVSIIFDSRRVDPSVLTEVRDKIMNLEVDFLQAPGQLERLISSRKRSLFPTMMITERPDRVTSSLQAGKVILLVQGSGFALILPATFYDFMHAVDDEYDSFWMTRFLITLRYIGVILTILLPSLYIAVVSYNPELFRVQLAFSIAGSRSAVPYPSFIEVMIMLFMIESLIEASVRLPKYIGSTATTVGGLILGQAAQQAGLVSSIMIIVTSVVAISNFVVPVNNMSTAIRFLKYPLIIPAIFFGLAGVAVGIFIYIVYLADLRSFGKPYFRFIGPTKRHSGDIGQVDQA